MGIFFTELVDEFKSAFAQIGVTGAFNAYLGRGQDSTEIIREDGLFPREMWWWRDTEQGREIDSSPLHPNCNIAYDNVTGLSNAQVRIGYPEGSKIQQILYLTPNVGMRSFGNQSPLDQKINSAFATPTSSQPDLRVGVTATPPLSVLASAGNYIRPSTAALRRFGGSTLSLSTEIGALGAGEHQLGLVCLDPETDTLVFQANTAVTATGSLPSRLEFTYTDVMAIPISTYIPLGSVYLYAGQTGISEDDLLRSLDPRVLYYAIQAYLALSGGTLTGALAGTDATFNRYALGASTTLTISAGAVTATKGYHLIESETGTSDDLTTISGMPARSWLVIQAAAGHTILVKNGTGNIFLNGGTDFSLAGDKTLLLYNDGTNISDLGAGGGGSVTSVTATAPVVSSGGTTPVISMDAQPLMRAFIGI